MWKREEKCIENKVVLQSKIILIIYNKVEKFYFT